MWGVGLIWGRELVANRAHFLTIVQAPGTGDLNSGGLAPVTLSAAGTVPVQGVGDQATGGAAVAADAAVLVQGVGDQTAADVGISADASVLVQGVGDQTTGGVTSSADGSVPVQGVGDQTAADATSVAAGVTWDVDQTALINFPKSSTEWSAFRAAKGLTVQNPNSLWLLQDASGNAADAIGALNLAATATLTYQAAVTGYARKKITSTDGGSGKLVLASGTGPSPATTSQTWLFVVDMPATPAANRSFMGVNTASSTAACRLLHLTTSGKIRLNVVGSTFDSVNSHSAGVHVLVVKYDRTNSEAKLYTDLEKLVATFNSGVTDGDKGLGNAGANTSSGRGALYGAMWSGANAEIADADVKALLQALGYTIPW